MNQREKDEYELMMLAERLESLREEMIELGVDNLRQLERRIEELHARLDELESKGQA